MRNWGLTSLSYCGRLEHVDEHDRPSLTADRRDAVAEMVARQGSARVSQIAERFRVSAATVRRDLEELEERGVVERVHGGAVAVREEESRHRASGKSSPPTGSGIGRAVADLISDGETVFLGPGSLCLEVARSLSDHAHITVITNGLEIAHWLAANASHRLILTGGQAEGPGMGLVGQMTRDTISSLRADHVVLELGGISAVEGLTDDSLHQAEIAQVLMEAGAIIVVVVSPERVGRVAAAPVAPVTSVDVIVTGREAPAAYLWDLSEVGVEIILG